MHVRPPEASDPVPFDIVLLAWAGRQAPPADLECIHGDRLALDMSPRPALDHRHRLFLADGRNAEVIAAEEYLAEVTGPRLAAWAADLRGAGVPIQLEPDRLLMPRDPAREAALVASGALIQPVSEDFHPDLAPVTRP